MLRALYKSVYGKEITEEEAVQLEWETKCELIR